MNKLVDQFGTKYFAPHYSGDVFRYLQTVQEVDLAGARICKDVIGNITSAANRGVVVRDTENASRDAFFAENRRRRKLYEELPPTTTLPIPYTLPDVPWIIKELDASKLYRIADRKTAKQCTFACMVQIVRPEIRLDLGEDAINVLQCIYNNLFPNPHRWGEFYVYKNPTFVVERCSGDYHEFISNNIVVPTEFGKVPLLHKPEWQACINRLNNILEKELRKRYRKLSEFL